MRPSLAKAPRLLVHEFKVRSSRFNRANMGIVTSETPELPETPEARREARWATIGVGVARWIALNMAIWPVVIAPSLLVFGALGAGTGDAGGAVMGIAMGLLVGAGLGIVFSVLGAPLLPFQRRIVGPRFPYLRWGYLAVVVYGPLLLLVWALFEGGGAALTILWLTPVYEVVALVTTILYARIGRAGGLFDDEVAPEGG